MGLRDGHAVRSVPAALRNAHYIPDHRSPILQPGHAKVDHLPISRDVREVLLNRLVEARRELGVVLHHQNRVDRLVLQALMEGRIMVWTSPAFPGVQ